jgi:CDP-glucose 4,6-dehydratase
VRKNILVTGCNGFVGTAACKYFTEQGNHVVGLVKDTNLKTNWDIQKSCSIVRGDICDREAVQYALSKYEIDWVLHLAAQPIVKICDNDPYTAYMTNIMGTVNILDSCRCLKRSLERIIVMTSDKAYGPHEVLPYKEDAPLVAADTYCTSKACQDMVARSYAKTYKLPVMVVRAGNLYGEGDLNTSRLIPNSIIKLLHGESPTLYSGVAGYIREFIYIDNIINAYHTLFEKGIPGEAYNVGGTSPQKILDVITMIRDKINPDIPISIVEREFFEIQKQYLDASKLSSLGWSPVVSISEGLDRTIEWFKARYAR